MNNENNQGRVPPYSEEAERAVLGAILLNNDALGEVNAVLKAEDFYVRAHRRIFEAMTALNETGKAIDHVILGNHLRDNGNIENAGGAMYLSGLTDETLVANVGEYAKTVKEKSARRQMINTAAEIVARGYSDYGDAAEYIEDSKRQLQDNSPSIKSPYAEHLALMAPIPDHWLEKEPGDVPQLLSRMCNKDNGETYFKDFLPQGVVGLLNAGGGTGKTTALTQLAIAAATGAPWLECVKVDNPGKVALLLGEEDASTIRRKIFYTVKILRKGGAEIGTVKNIIAAGLSGKDVGLVHGGDKLKSIEPGTPTTWAKTLFNQLENQGKWSLIILDPLSRWAGPGVETDNEVATKFIEAAEKFRELPGNPTVLIAAHTSQADRKNPGIVSPRGVTGQWDGARWQASLVQQTEITYEKDASGAFVKDHNGRKVVEDVKQLNKIKFRIYKNNLCGPDNIPIWLEHNEHGILVPFGTNAGEAPPPPDPRVVASKDY